MNLSKHTLPFLSLLLAAIIWGAATPVAKIALFEIPPFVIIFLRFLFATAVMAAILAAANVHTPIRKKHIILLTIVGLANSTVNLVLAYSGLSLTTALDTIVIGATGPLLIALGGWLFLKERIGRLGVVGQLLAIVGVFFVVSSPTDGISTNKFLGDILILGAVISAAVGVILSKELFRTYHAMTLTAAIFLVGAVSSAPLAAWQHLSDPTWLEQVSVGAWAGVIFLAVFSSVVAYLAFEWGLEHSTASLAGITGHFTLLVGAVLSVLLIGERLSPGFIFGAGLIILGVILATRPVHHFRKAHVH